MRERCATAIAFLALLAVTGYSQTQASITGRTTDESGAVLPGVTITVQNVQTGTTQTTLTNESGLYTVPLLPVGEYTVKAEFIGFQSAMRRNVVLEVGYQARIDFQLHLGSVTEFLEVTADAPLVQSESSSVGQVIENTKIVNLPLNGRNYNSLALLVPGTMLPADGTSYGSRGGINVAGNREYSQQYSLDGVDMTEAMMRVPVFSPSIDMIQEFKVATSTYNAEMGRRSGGQISIVTKSGTNDFHGSAYEFLRNSALDAKNFFDPPNAPTPPFRWNQFGATFGGPIRKNQTFFFSSWESFRQRKSVTRTATVPDPRWLRGDFSTLPTSIIDPATGRPFPGNIIPQDRMNPVGKALAAWYPAANLPGTVRNYVNSPQDQYDTDQYSIKIDHRFSNAQSIYVRYSYFDFLHVWPFGFNDSRYSNIAGESVLGGAKGNLTSETHTQPAHQVVINLTSLISSNVVNELKLGYSRLDFYRNGTDTRDIASMIGLTGLKLREKRNFGVPGVRVQGFDSLGGSGRPVGRGDNTYQITESVTYTHGRHSVKFGADLKRFNNNRLQENGSKGNFQFTNRYTGNAVGDLLLGLPSQTSRLVGSGVQPVNDNSYHLYIQDDWKIRPNLTLNIGLRYEMNTPMVTADNRTTTFDPTLNAIVIAGKASVRRDINRPDLTDSDIMRATAGIKFVDNGNRRIWDMDYNNWSPRFGLAYRPFGNDHTVIRTGYGIFYDEILGQTKGNLSNNFPFTFSQQFNANATTPNINMSDPFPTGLGGGTISITSVDRRWGTPYTQHFNLSIQHEPFRDTLIEAAYVGSKGTRLESERNLNQAFLGAGTIASRRPYPLFGNMSVQEANGLSNFHSMQLRFEKRSSKNLTFLTSYTLSKTIDMGSGGGSSGDGTTPQDSRNVFAERGLANFDARHRLVFSSVYPLPFGAGRTFLAGAGRAVNAILGGWGLSGIFTLQSGRPLTPAISTDYNQTGQTDTDRPNRIADGQLPSSQRTLDRWFDTSAFVLPRPGVFGNAGRGILKGPGVNSFDVALLKIVDAGDRLHFQLRAEFFNLLNHPNFNMPNRNADVAQFGRIFSARDPRQIQFGLKLLF